MTKPHYVIIDTIGRAENVKENHDWFHILDEVYLRFSGAGTNSPLPNILLRDGQIIVPGRLWEVAADYNLKLRTEIGRVTKEIRDRFPEPEPET